MASAELTGWAEKVVAYLAKVSKTDSRRIAAHIPKNVCQVCHILSYQY